MLEKIRQKTWNMTPTWSQNGSTNPLKIHEQMIQKNITNNGAKMKRPKALDPEGPRARSAGRGKELLRRLQVKVSSCIQHRQKTNIRQKTKKQPRTSGS